MLRREFSCELIKDCEFGDHRRNYAVYRPHNWIVEKGSVVVREIANSRLKKFDRGKFRIYFKLGMAGE